MLSGWDSKNNCYEGQEKALQQYISRQASKMQLNPEENKTVLNESKSPKIQLPNNEKGPDAMPVRPREINLGTTVPPKCPIDGINFIQLKPKKNLPTCQADRMD